MVNVMKNVLLGGVKCASKYSKCEYKDGSIGYKKVRLNKIRGNAQYAYYMRDRLRIMASKLQSMIKVDSNMTNGLFVTVTFKHETGNLASVNHTWEVCKQGIASGNLNRKLMRIGKRESLGFNIVAYLRSVEAQLSGACHLHIPIVLDNQIEYEKIYNSNTDKWEYIPKDSRVTDLLFSKIEKVFGKQNVNRKGFNVQCVYKVDGLHSYISKEMNKQHGALESILKKCDKQEELTEWEVKTFYTHYYTHKHKIDMIRGTNNLSGVDNVNSNEENETAEPLISNKELDDKFCEYMELGSIILTNEELWRHIKRSETSPYNGFLEQGRELDLVKALIEEQITRENRIKNLVLEAMGLNI